MLEGWLANVALSSLKIADPKTLEFTRQDFIKQELETVVENVGAKGKTNDQTLSQVFQQLRDCSLLTFVRRGIYQLKKLEVKIDFSKKRSKGERLVGNLLRELGIPFEEQKTFSDLKHKGLLRFDFYFEHEGRKFAIEFQGEQHYRPIDYFGGEKAFEEQQIRDKIKEDYCKKNDIKLIKVNILKTETVKKKVASELLEVLWKEPKLRPRKKITEDD